MRVHVIIAANVRLQSVVSTGTGVRNAVLMNGPRGRDHLEELRVERTESARRSFAHSSWWRPLRVAASSFGIDERPIGLRPPKPFMSSRTCPGRRSSIWSSIRFCPGRGSREMSWTMVDRTETARAGRFSAGVRREQVSGCHKVTRVIQAFALGAGFDCGVRTIAIR